MCLSAKTLNPKNLPQGLVVLCCASALTVRVKVSYLAPSTAAGHLAHHALKGASSACQRFMQQVLAGVEGSRPTYMTAGADRMPMLIRHKSDLCRVRMGMQSAPVVMW